MKDGLYQVKTQYLCAGFVVRYNRIIQCAPILRKTFDRWLPYAEFISPNAAYVVNVKDTQYFDVYIGRPSKYGNPFYIGTHGTREEVIEKYEKWILREVEAPDGSLPPTLEEIEEELTDKVLACHCPPLPCHGDVLCNLVNIVIPSL